MAKQKVRQTPVQRNVRPPFEPPSSELFKPSQIPSNVQRTAHMPLNQLPGARPPMQPYRIIKLPELRAPLPKFVSPLIRQPTPTPTPPGLTREDAIAIDESQNMDDEVEKLSASITDISMSEPSRLFEPGMLPASTPTRGSKQSNQSTIPEEMDVSRGVPRSPASRFVPVNGTPSRGQMDVSLGAQMSPVTRPSPVTGTSQRGQMDTSRRNTMDSPLASRSNRLGVTQVGREESAVNETGFSAIEDPASENGREKLIELDLSRQLNPEEEEMENLLGRKSLHNLVRKSLAAQPRLEVDDEEEEEEVRGDDEGRSSQESGEMESENGGQLGALHLSAVEPSAVEESEEEDEEAEEYDDSEVIDETDLSSESF